MTKPKHHETGHAYNAPYRNRQSYCRLTRSLSSKSLIDLFDIVLAMRPADRAGWKHLLESGDVELTSDRMAWLRALRMAEYRDRAMAAHAVHQPRTRRARTRTNRAAP